MKKLLLGSILLVAALAGGRADAADIPSPVYKTPSAPVTAPSSWTGFYVGVNAGYGWKDPTVTYTPNDPGALATSCGGAFGGTCIPPATFGIGGAAGGIQAGYNWQLDQHWLAGLEADFDGAGLKGTGTSIFTLSGPNPGSNFQATEKIQWFGTMRARLGFLPTQNFVFYGTGGLAYGQVDANANLNTAAGANISVISFPGPVAYGYACTTGAGCFTGNKSELAVGWTIGAGGEYAITSNITVKAEYLYVDLGHAIGVNSVAVNAGGNAVASSFTANISSVSFNVVRAGVNWKF
jgi:outer membrane immunogenic protein